MRNENRVLGLALSAALALGCGSGAGLDSGRLPPSMRAGYRRFEVRCSRCHSLSRPLSAPVDSAEHWEKYLARMRRMPGSGINHEDAALILEFLTYYTVVVRQGEPFVEPGAQVEAEAVIEPETSADTETPTESQSPFEPTAPVVPVPAPEETDDAP